MTGTGTGTVATTIASSAITTAKINANAVTNAKMATSTANTLAGYDNSGAHNTVTVGSGLSLSGGTLTTTGSGSGTVTSVSVVSANGLAGTVATATTTPAITLSTSITGILKGNGTAISAATAGTDFENPLTFSTGLTRSVNTITVNNSQNIATLSNLTTNGFIKTSGGTGALSVDTNTYLTANQSITLSGDLSGSGSTAIAATIASNAVTTAKINANAVTNAKMATSTANTLAGYDNTGAHNTVTVGSGLSLSAGTLTATGAGSGTVTSVSVTSANGFAGSVATATSTPAITISTSISGVLKGNGTAISAATAGTDFVAPGTVTGYTAQQYAVASALTAGATVSWNLNTAQAATLTANQNFTLSNPTNMQAGGTYTLVITQDATGSRVITWGSAYKFSGGSKFVLSTAASAVDIITFYSDGTNMYAVGQAAFS